MSRHCVIEKCSRLSRALCNCCETYLCLDHLKEHTDRINEQLLPLSDRFNQLIEELKNLSLIEISFIKELDQWHFQAHQQIEYFYQEKRNEFEQYFQESKQNQTEEFLQIRQQVQELIHQQDATNETIQSLNNTLQLIEQQINSIRNPYYKLSPLIIDKNLISISKQITMKNLLPLSSPYRTITRQETSYFSLATNEKYILICQQSKLCLINEQMKIEKEIPWKYDQIWDMFFSTYLHQFILITQQDIFYLHENTMILNKYSYFYNNNINQPWYCGTSHNELLFLSKGYQGSSIYEYQMIPSIQLIKEWSSPLSCLNDELICDLRSNHCFLAMIILNERKNETRLELRSSKTFQPKWFIYIATAAQFDSIRCCSLFHNQWLVIDTINSDLLHINEDGKLIQREKYNPLPGHIVQFNKHFIVISTARSFNLHRLY